MSTSNDRVEQFKADINGLNIKDPSAAKDGLWLRLGGLMMLVGLVVTVVAYFLSHNTTNPLEQNDALIVGLIGIVVTIIGAALFVRFSFAGFLKFWLARLIHEQRQAVGNRVVVDDLSDVI